MIDTAANKATVNTAAAKTATEPQKLDYIDGLKVLACLIIFNFHFINAFYCGFSCCTCSNQCDKFVLFHFSHSPNTFTKLFTLCKL